MTETEKLLSEMKEIASKKNLHTQNETIKSKLSLVQHTLCYNSEQLDDESMLGLAHLAEEAFSHMAEVSDLLLATSNYLFNLKEEANNQVEPHKVDVLGL